MEHKNSTPPIDYNIPEFKFPIYETVRISDKLSLFLVIDNTQLLSSIKVIFPLGGFHEKTAGLACFSSKIATRGTASRSSKQIANEIETLGAMLNSSEEWDYTSFSIVSLNEFIGKAVDILSDCVFNPVFSEDEITKFKTKHIADIEQEMAESSYMAGITLNKQMFRDFPYGHELIGNRDSIMSISRNDCLDWHNSLLSSDEIYIIATGNFDGINIVELIRKKFDFSKDNKPNGKAENIGMPKAVSKNKIIVTEKSDMEQTTFRIGRFTENITHPDFQALQFINTIYGGFFLSRLNELLREKLGYTYGISSYINPKKYTSVQVISTSVNKDASVDTINKIVEQMDILNKNRIAESELVLARQYLLGSFLRSLETPYQISALVKNLIIQKLPSDYYDKFFQSIKDISVERLFECQQKYYKSEGLIISAVGEEGFIAKELDTFKSDWEIISL